MGYLDKIKFRGIVLVMLICFLFFLLFDGLYKIFIDGFYEDDTKMLDNQNIPSDSINNISDDDPNITFSNTYIALNHTVKVKRSRTRKRQR